MEQDASSVRSASEEGQRKVVTAVQEMLERRYWETESSKQTKKSKSKKRRKSKFPFEGPGSPGSLGMGGRGGLEFEDSKMNDESNGGNEGSVGFGVGCALQKSGHQSGGLPT